MKHLQLRKVRTASQLLSSACLCGVLTASTASADGHLSGDITMIKGPHSVDEAKFEAMIIDDFKSVEPNVDVTFTTYDWANMNAELTTGFASGNPADVLYLVDLIYPAYAQQGALHDMTALVNSADWADERAEIPGFAWALAEQDGGTWGFRFWVRSITSISTRIFWPKPVFWRHGMIPMPQ